MERVGKDDRIIAYLRTVSVGNLPHGVSKERLKGIFENFGSVETVVISSQTTACVVYKKSSDAEEAIQRINFGEPLTIDGKQIHVFMWKEVGLNPLDSLFNTLDAECSICVSNISRTTTPQALKSYFSVFGGINSIKYEPKIKGIGEARRFAHITYIHGLHRDMALQADGTSMDGSKLMVEPCYRRQRRQQQQQQQQQQL